MALPDVQAAGVPHVCCGGLQVRVVRIFNTYGPRMALDDGRVVSNFLAQALTGKPLTIYGDGQQTRSFQFISDLVEGAAGAASALLLAGTPLLPSACMRT